MTTNQSDTDGLQALVRAWADAVYNESGETPVPMATTDVIEVVKSQLTENTGSHFLDSGSAYGRHHEENRENPPWEQPEWDVGRGYVVHNVYHYLTRTLERDQRCVAAEALLYAYGNTSDRKRDSWGQVCEEFAETITAGEFHEVDLRDGYGLPEEFVADALGLQRDLKKGRKADRLSRRDGRKPLMRFNTYNHECHSLSQCLEVQMLGGPYAEYAIVRVHQGADVRGGYTGPRVYSVWDGALPSELWFHCEECGWDEAESCLYDSDALEYHPDENRVEHVGPPDPDSDGECGGNVHFG